MTGILAAFGSAVKYSGLLTASTNGLNTERGYNTSPAFGSMTPTTIEAHTIVELWDAVGGGSQQMSIGGFGADPGKSFFTSVSANGVTKTSASAGYSYAGGVATWQWAGGNFGFVNTNVYPVLIL